MRYETGAKTVSGAMASMRARGVDPMKYDYHRTHKGGEFIAVSQDDPFEKRLIDAIEGVTLKDDIKEKP